MSDNLANLRNYQIQLQQVEIALASDADNEELKKLQVDLQEVINLTMGIMDPDEIALLDNHSTGSKAHNFKAGDYVLAPWSEDGQFYEAQIEDITSDGQCTVVFSHQKKRISEVCLVELIKPLSGKRQRTFPPQSSSAQQSSSKFNQNYNAKTIGLTSSGAGGDNDRAGNTMNHFKRAQEAREAQKKKTQKRKDKLKMLEEEREKDKMKWQSFSSKVSTSKKFKGSSTKKSIFATPESVEGRVGVGTCGVGGRPMTEYQMKMEKVKKTVTSLPKLSFATGEDEDRDRGSSHSRGGDDHRSSGQNRNRF